jgi:DNA-binding MarR family transcriptional regulator
MNSKGKENSMTLELLEAIEEKSDVTQRRLARELGVALGLANSYLKRCERKGLVKIHKAPANRYLYYLTPKGFAEKSRLTAEYLSASFSPPAQRCSNVAGEGAGRESLCVEHPSSPRSRRCAPRSTICGSHGSTTKGSPVIAFSAAQLLIPSMSTDYRMRG